MSFKLFAILVVSLVSTCDSAAKEDPKWWQVGTIYQIYPRSFKDSNNDGIGDLKGITSGLKYLADIGITAIWLSPIYPSPMVDFGYDISDFKDINPEYGTLEDFDEMVLACKELGLKVVMDFVPNHSSNQHKWFINSVKKVPGYEDYYVWKDPKGVDENGKPIPPNNWLSLFYGPAWEYNEERKQFYLHQFAVAQPDLNYNNPKVAQEMKDVISFWMDRGVDGFRIDAIPFLFEDPEFTDEFPAAGGSTDPDAYESLEHSFTRDRQETYDMVGEWRALIDAKSAQDNVDRCLMMEAYASVSYTMKYFGTPEKPLAHFPFNFNFIPISNETTAQDLRRMIHEWVDNVPSNGSNNWLTGNHDNHRIGSRIGEDLIDGMNTLISFLPGATVTYYGEELGMLDNLDISYDDGKDPSGCNYPEDQWYQRSRDFERTPFQWNDSVNAGFNEGAEPWLPVHRNYKQINVAAELKDENSHLAIYKRNLANKKTELVQRGSLNVQIAGQNTLAVHRYLRPADNSYGFAILVINLGENDEVVDLDALFAVGPDVPLTVRGFVKELKSRATMQASSVTVPARRGFILDPPAKKLV